MANQSSTLYQLYIELENVQPAVWRRLLLPAEMRLSELHPILQAAMGWQDMHYYCFVTADQRFFTDEEVINQGFDEWQDDTTARLQDVLTMTKPELFYEYDFGDGWRHRIRLEKALPLIGAQPSEALCLAGENACPPESCGGIPGYQHLVAILKDPQHDEYEELCDWLGTDSFDPAYFDEKSVNARLEAIHHYSPLLVNDELFDAFKYVQPEIDRLLQQGEFESDMIRQAFIDQFLLHIMEDDEQPLVELPMSPHLLHQLLYRPFEAPEVLQFNPAAATPENSPLLALFKTLAECAEEKGIKLTKKGNLPLAIVRKMVDAVDPALLHYNRFIWQRGYRSEEDVPPVHYSRIIAIVSGLCRVVKDQLVLTRKGQTILKKQDWPAAFHTLMQGLFSQFNWAYVDGYPSMPSIRLTALVLLYRLHTQQSKLKSVDAAQYLQALFPHMLAELDEEGFHMYREPGEVFTHVVKHRLATLLTLAGLIAFDESERGIPFEDDDSCLELSPLGHGYFLWQTDP
jgi:hypothetical protein